MASAAAAALIKEAAACEQRKDLHEAVSKLEQVGPFPSPIAFLSTVGLFMTTVHAIFGRRGDFPRGISFHCVKQTCLSVK
jgi:hypothetical protein